MKIVATLWWRQRSD